jgi:phospholipase C
MTNESRRGFLSASAAKALAGALPLGLRNALAARPAGSSLAAVKHVVVFMQENRSFDHYFGTLQGVRGFGDRAALMRNGGPSVFKQQGVLGTYYPFHMDTAKTSAQCVVDLDHSWVTQHWAVNGGRMDLWIDAKTPMTMGGYNRADIPFHFALADAFTICDQYFSSIQGPTNPNRLYLWTGMIDPHGTGGGPVTDNSEAGYSWTTYPERLQSAGVSWKVYQKVGDNYDDNALAWFKQYQSAPAGSPLHDRGMSSVPALTGDTVADIAAAIRADVLGGTLPQVSWIVAPESSSEHPSYSPAAGADMINQVLEALTADPAVWASTVLFVNYDENDGFFDHAVPPLPPAGTPDEFVSGLPIGLGVRVPMTVVSPWSRGGNVCSQVFDHTSVIRFIETWTGVREPNISAWRRQVCGDLTGALDFTSSSVSVPGMPDTATLAQQAAHECSHLPPPLPQSKSAPPPQEPGPRPARPLPYQPNANASADKASGRLWITMTNTGSQSVHCAVHTNHYRIDGPWQYDVAPGATVKDYFSAQLFGGGKYDLSLYGPNGFRRRFIGNIDGAGGKIEVEASYDFSVPGHARLVLSMVNGGKTAALFTVASNAYRGDGPWLFSVAPGARAATSWDVQADTAGWYDFTVTADADKLFSRTFAGHVELGVASITG